MDDERLKYVLSILSRGAMIQLLGMYDRREQHDRNLWRREKKYHLWSDTVLRKVTGLLVKRGDIPAGIIS